jgi:bifunctional non-homologous end joining protein LigD
LTAREGRVYLDYLQNRRGQLLVAPYSLRPLPGAPASAPLRWEEVNSDLSLDAFNLASMPNRLDRLDGDPLVEILGVTPNLSQVLNRLALLLNS